MKTTQHLILGSVLLLLLFPILFFQSEFAISNLVTDLPILIILNLILLLFFLEREIRKFQYQSVFLLVIAAVSVFSSFFRLIPMPTGVTLAFLLPISAGLVFGSSFGFIIGQLSMLVGGVFLGAFGPWLPYQVFLMGFIGYYAGTIFHQRVKLEYSMWSIILYVIILSFLYGFWMSITDWPIVAKNLNIPASKLKKMKFYVEFYLTTSFVWDATRALGNIIVFKIFFHPTCELLKRAKNRLTYYR